MEWITTERLQREFALPRVLASEIVAEQLQFALLNRWQPWVWLACWALPVLACWFGWLPWSLGADAFNAGLWLSILASDGWVVIGRWLAGPAILAAAAARAERLQRAGEGWAAHGRAASTTSLSPTVARVSRS